MFSDIIHGDSLKELPKIQDSIVDEIITDPPFAINFKSNHSSYNRKSNLVLDGYKEILENEYEEFSLKWLTQCYRVLKESGSIFVFSGYNNLEYILRGLRLAGFTVINHIVWKYQFGVYTKQRFVTSHYLCIYACKNNKKRKFFRDSKFKKTKDQYNDMLDVWDIKREYWRGKEKTPTKLPSEIIEKILDYTTSENDLILDPFLGSGQVAKVSKNKNRDYLGIEIVKEYYDFAINHIKNTLN